MNLKLVSDFSELYDSFFDSTGFEHRRVTTDGPNRIQMFRMFTSIGMDTPLYGYLSQFKDYPDKEHEVVIYDDLKSHFGQDKRISTINNVLTVANIRKSWTVFCSLFINTETDTYKSKSTRVLVIGKRAFSYEYISYNDWRSNCGEGDIINAKEIPAPNWRNNIPYPMFAIDFVEDKAVDFNIAPGITGTGVGKLISCSEIILSLKNWYREYFNG
jgi:hypothetical protein